MERQEVYKKLNEIFEETLDLEGIELTDESSANDIEEWDSLANIQLVIAIQKAFNIKFNSTEILTWNNVGDMVNCILSK